VVTRLFQPFNLFPQLFDIVVLSAANERVNHLVIESNCVEVRFNQFPSLVFAEAITLDDGGSHGHFVDNFLDFTAMSTIVLVVSRAETERDSVRWGHLGLTVPDAALKSVHVLLDFVVIVRVGVFSQRLLVLLELYPELLETALVLVRRVVVCVDSLCELIEVHVATRSQVRLFSVDNCCEFLHGSHSSSQFFE